MTTVNLSAFAKKESKSKSGKTYPYLPDPAGDIAEVVDSVIEHSQQIEALKGALDADSAELKSKTLTWAFRHFNGTDAPSTVKLMGSNGKAIAVSVTSRYYPINATVDDSGEVPNPRIEGIRKTIGESAFNEFFEDGFTISIDSSKIPKDKQQDFIESLIATCSMFGVEDAVSAKQFFLPRPSFHTERHRKFTAEQNLEIHKHLPSSVSLKAKGVKP